MIVVVNSILHPLSEMGAESRADQSTANIEDPVSRDKLRLDLTQVG